MGSEDGRIPTFWLLLYVYVYTYRYGEAWPRRFASLRVDFHASHPPWACVSLSNWGLVPSMYIYIYIYIRV